MIVDQLTTAVLKLMGTVPITSDNCTIFSIIGPRNGEISYLVRGLRRRIVGVDKVSRDNV